MNANDRQVAGTHYKAAYQHWDLVADLRLGYFEGQVTKYVARWRKKNGLQDLQKAMHFLEKLLELVTVHGWGPRGSASGGYSGKTISGEEVQPGALVARFAMSNALRPTEKSIIGLVACWHHPSDLRIAAGLLREIMDTVQACEPGPGYVRQEGDRAN